MATQRAFRFPSSSFAIVAIHRVLHKKSLVLLRSGYSLPPFANTRHRL